MLIQEHSGEIDELPDEALDTLPYNVVTETLNTGDWYVIVDERYVHAGPNHPDRVIVEDDHRSVEVGFVNESHTCSRVFVERVKDDLSSMSEQVLDTVPYNDIVNADTDEWVTIVDDLVVNIGHLHPHTIRT